MATEYRGLDPRGPIFLTDDGAPYKLFKRRPGSGSASYSCDFLGQFFRKLHLQAGIGVQAQCPGAGRSQYGWRTRASTFGISMNCWAMKL